MSIRKRMPNAAQRVKLRRLAAGLLLSLGTAVFSAAIGLIVTAADSSAPYHWPTTLALTGAGLALSGTGSWLLSSTRASLAIVIVATDSAGDIATYHAAITGFLTYAAQRYTQLASSEVVVQQPDDLKVLRTVALDRITDHAAPSSGIHRVGLAFQGRHHVAFHLGSTLIIPGKTITLYHARRQPADDSHLLAQRALGHIPNAPSSSASLLAIQVRHVHQNAYTHPRNVASPDELRAILNGRTSGPIALAINLQGPVGDPAMLTPVTTSALTETATTLVTLGLRQDDTNQPALRGVPETTEAFESIIAAVADTARRLPTDDGLIYINGPAIIALALGRLLRNTAWTPMRHLPHEGTYERFPRHD